jgi:lipopolysaccharide export LptBFGC system permease protein LptF
LEEEQDPPCFTHARKKAKQQAEELSNPEITSEIEKFQFEIDNILGIRSEKDSGNILETVAGDKENRPNEISLIQTAESTQNIQNETRTAERGTAEVVEQQARTVVCERTADYDGTAGICFTNVICVVSPSQCYNVRLVHCGVD